MRTPPIVLAIAVGVAMHAHNAAAQARITQCQTLTEPGDYRLAQNLSATGDCLVVRVDFVNISLAGFTITGDGTGAGIRAEPVDPEEALVVTVVAEGTITGFGEAGIFARAAS